MSTPLVVAAREIAMTAHATQFYPPERGPVSFAMHLGHAVSVLHRFGVEDEVIEAATWLHDILEDTPMTATKLADRLLETVGHDSEELAMTMQVVTAVTDEPGTNRAERKARTYPKIAAKAPHAVFVKLADRIANVEASLLGGRGNGEHYLSMYRKEHPGFIEALNMGRTITLREVVMWAYLNHLIAE